MRVSVLAFLVGARGMTAVPSRSDMIPVSTQYVDLIEIQYSVSAFPCANHLPRGSLHAFSVGHVRPSGRDTGDFIYDPHRSPHRLFFDTGHASDGYCRPRTRPFAFFSVSTNSFHFRHHNFSSMSTFIPNRCLTLRAPHGMGFVPGSGGNHPRLCQLHSLVCHAPHPCEPEGKEESDSGAS